MKLKAEPVVNAVSFTLTPENDTERNLLSLLRFFTPELHIESRANQVEQATFHLKAFEVRSVT